MILRKSKYFILILLLMISGCGIYSFRGRTPPEGIRSVAIPLFNDESGFSEAGLKENFTETLKKKIIDDNTYILADRNVADGIILGTIVSVRDEPLVISGNENVTKRKIVINVKIRFENLKNQRLISESNYENWGEYDSSSGGFSNRRNGILIAMEKICEDIIINITSNW
ncbi:MAG: LPS assembly lipoprotein LptE [Ignavibacteria bacterium]|nr:LPS assembly lipoprotein LptE [Ignavibacteria bacterium]